MTFHYLKEYIRYKLTAKGRHGVHSPFVYALVEKALRQNGTGDRQDMPRIPATPARTGNLIARITGYCSLKEIKLLQDETAHTEIGGLIITGEQLQNEQWIIKRLPDLKEHVLIFILDIHRSAENTAAWKRLRHDEHVTLSIDLFNIGVLFFRKEFKEKQHFVLRS